MPRSQLKQLFQPGAARFAEEIAFLLDQGVSDTLLASLLGISLNHLRVLKYRAARATRSAFGRKSILRRDSRWLLQPTESLLIEPPDSLIELEHEVKRIYEQYRARYQFFRGIVKLRSLLARVGRIDDPRRRRLLARVHQLIAWFFVHSGYSSSAYAHAKFSMSQSQIVHDQLVGHGQPKDCLDLRRFAETSLIGALAARMGGRRDLARECLELGRTASEMAHISLRSEYHRQWGTLLMKNNPEKARSYFNEAAHAMRRDSEARNEAHVRMVSTRQVNFMRPLNCDAALGLAQDVRETFGQDSIEYVLASHWAVACGLASGSKHWTNDVLELLDNNSRYAKRFGNQSGISRLLEITPQLKLSSAVRYKWLLLAMSSNPFRFH